MEYLLHTNVGKVVLTGNEKRSALKRFMEYLDDRVIFIEEITPHQIEDYFYKRLDGTISGRKIDKGGIKKGSIAGANQDLKLIKHLLNFAVSRGYLHSSPAPSIKKVKEVRKIFRDSSFEEIHRLIETARDKYPHLYPIIAAAYYLGLRRNELVFLEWADIDYDKNVVYVRSKKENRVKDCGERSIPLNTKLRNILDGLPRKERFVFLTPSGTTHKNNLYREFQKVVKDTGLHDVNIQTLRETFGSHLLRKGISIYLVSKYLGHSSIDVTTRHYAYIATQMTHDEINVL